MLAYEIVGIIGIHWTITLVIIFAVVAAVFVPKGFMRIGPNVRSAQSANRIHESVLSGLAYKYDRTGRGFGDKNEYMYWTERLANGDLRVCGELGRKVELCTRLN